MRLHAGKVGILLLLVAAVYWPVCHFGFVDFDDPENIYQEPHILGGPSAVNIRWAMSVYQMGHWVPLTRLSYLMDQSLFQLNPGVMHLEDALLHFAGSMMVYAVLMTMTGAVRRSWIAAILFAVHPMHVESVAWITERRDVLSTPLLMLAILAYAYYVRSDSSRRKAGWYLAAILFYAFSLTAKAMGITLPVLLLLLDFWPLRRSDRPWRSPRLLMEKLPFLVLAAAASVQAVRAQAAVGAAVSIAALPVSARLGNAVVAYVIYIVKLLVPTGLSAMYVLPAEPRPVQQVAAAALLLALLAAFAVRWRRRCPYLLVGMGWFFITLLPVSGIVQSGFQAMADRYSYVPSIGFFIAVVWGGSAFAVAVSGRWAARITATAEVVVILALTVMAHVQLGYWKTTRQLLQHALALDEGNWFAEYHIALEEAKAGNYSTAMPMLSHVVQENPHFADAYIDYGNCLFVSSPAKSLAVYDLAVQTGPNIARAYSNRGNARLACGDTAGACADYAKAVQLAPDVPDNQRQLAIAERLLKR